MGSNRMQRYNYFYIKPKVFWKYVSLSTLKIFFEMRKIVLMGIMAIVAVLASRAQTAAKLFSQMPDSVIKVLTKNNRLDCIDFVESGMRATVENALGGRSELLKLTDDYLMLKISDVSEMSFRRLSLSDSTSVICLVHTYRMPAAESEIRFYTTEWEQLPATSFFSCPSPDSCWILSDTCDSFRFSEAQSLLDVPVWEARLSETAPTLELRVSLAGLTEESQEKVKGYLRPPLKYEWKNGNWALVSL